MFILLRKKCFKYLKSFELFCISSNWSISLENLAISSSRCFCVISTCWQRRAKVVAISLKIKNNFISYHKCLKMNGLSKDYVKDHKFKIFLKHKVVKNKVLRMGWGRHWSSKFNMTVGLIPSGFKINAQQALFPLPYGCKHEQAIKRQTMGIFLQKHSKPHLLP